MTLLGNNWFLASFSATLISANYWPIMPSWRWLLLIVIAILLIMRLKRWRSSLGIGLALVVAICSGNLIQRKADTLFQAGGNIIINGQVDSPFKQISHGYEGIIYITHINGQPLRFFDRPRIRLIAPILLTQNDVFAGWVNIKPIYGLLNQAGFDSETFALSQQVLARATLDPQHSWRVTSAYSVRLALIEKVSLQLAEASHSALLMALSFGVRDQIEAEQWQQLKQSGLIHLLSISGLHIGMAFGCGYWLGHWMRAGQRPLLFVPTMLGLVFAWAYAWLAGFTLPTQRALIFCLLMASFSLMNWQISRWSTLLWVLACCLVLSPFSPLSSSFWLSFLAVGAVFLTINRGHFHASWRKRVTNLLLTQALLLLFLAPVTGHFFSGFSFAALIYNLVFIPWFTLAVVPLVLAGLLFSALSLSSVATLIWQLADWSLQPLSMLLPYARHGWWPLTDGQIAVITLLALLILYGRLFTPSFALTVFGISIAMTIGYRQQGEVRIDLLDVGHGLAVLIEKNDHLLLYDTGKGWFDGSIAQQVIEPVMLKRGHRGLDGLILSHLDNDHAGGKAYVEAMLSPKWRMSSSQQEHYLPCLRGEQHEWQGMKLEVLWPPKLVKRAYNPHSCVIRLSDWENQFSILLTGDIDAVAEWILAREPEKVRSDIMLVPHHGSLTSSSPDFVAAVTPQLALASLAKGNQWGMPRKEVLRTYQQHEVRWLDTGEEGQITVLVHQGRWSVKTLRSNSLQPWYRQMLRNQVE
ncbi:DNA internalization-related competence protein ComEC/Rec2 [Vibrio navarrensis]|uniref:DNA internalization-related competence protein ComEC/Rec2 n=1 Tax=Vibrio navarrensis TaxID=29495 RepID=A0AAJ4ICS5_9VIBR|nr:competence protein ComEC [Vibrio sp. S234-5]MBE3652917.1 DNA internalization-related competence protein ComEC/Rec2 [Vibrio navarrensis]MBE3657507.1 DNA internalization-related competence protein ComEC/Rec2 [Vibrio navarrensis]MBE3661144.1 DNA internalization-related competence protein ComEC/Rec2 [Vibrio navarrensis]MBE4605421.1 DNA internalization-related competence protein ComEC/Rec2 [Vibrio navarrensis]